MQCIDDIKNKCELETEEKLSSNLDCEAAVESDKTHQVFNLSSCFDNDNKYLLFENVSEDIKSVEDYLDNVTDSDKEKIEQNDLSLPEIESNEVIDPKNIYASSKIYEPKLKNTKLEMSLLGKHSDEVITENLNQRLLLDKSMPIDLNYDASNANCTIENEISYEPFAIGYTGLNPVRKSIASSLQELSENLNNETFLTSTDDHTAKKASKKPNFFKSKLKVGHLPKTLTKSQKSTTLSLKGKNKTSERKSSPTTSCNLLDSDMLESGNNITSEDCYDSANKTNKDIKCNQQLQKEVQNKSRVKLKYSGNNEIKMGKQLRVNLTDLFPNKSKEDYINLYKHKESSCSDSAIDSKNTIALPNFKDEINSNSTLQDNLKKTKSKKQTKIMCNSVISNKSMLKKEMDSSQSDCLSNPVISNVQQISLKEFNSTSNTEDSLVEKTSLLESEVNTNAKKKITLVKKVHNKSLVSVNGINSVVNESENILKNRDVEKSKSINATTPPTKQSPFMQLVSKFVDNKPENSQTKVFPARQDFINFLSNSSKKNPNVSSKERNYNDQVTPSPKRGRKRKMDKILSTANGNDPCCSKSMKLKDLQVQNSESADKSHDTKFISSAEIHVPPKSFDISKSSLSPFRKPGRLSKGASQNSLKSILDEHLLPVSSPSQIFSNDVKISANSAVDENNGKDEDRMNSSKSIKNNASCSQESKLENNNTILNKNTKCNSSRMSVKSSKSQHYVTNNRHTSVNGLKLFKQSKDDICFKSPLKSSDASSVKNTLGGMDCSIKSDFKDNVDALNAFGTESFNSNTPEDNILETKEQLAQGRKKTKNQSVKVSDLHSPCSLLSNSKKRSIKTKLGRDDDYDAESFCYNISKSPASFSPIEERLKKREERRSMETKLAKKYISNVNAEAILSASECPLVQEKPKRGRKKKFPPVNQFPETPILNSEAYDAEPIFNAFKSVDDISPVQEKSKRGRKKKSTTVNQFSETHIKTFDDEFILNTSECSPVHEKLKRGRKKNLPADNQSLETSILDSPSSRLSSTKSKSELQENGINIGELLIQSSKRVKKKIKAENSNIVSDSTKSLNNSYYETTGRKESKQERNNKKSTAIKIKDIINSPKSIVPKSKNNPYLKNNYCHSKSLKNLSKNNESRTNVSAKRFEYSGCDLIGSVKMKKAITSPHAAKTYNSSAGVSDSSEIDDFFVNGDNAWPTQDARILNEDIRSKTSKRSARRKSNSLKATKFFKDDYSGTLRKTSKFSDHDAVSLRKSMRVKKKSARYSSDAFFSPDDKKSELYLPSPATENIEIERSLKNDNENKSNHLNSNQSFSSASLNTPTSTASTVSGSFIPNQNPIVNTAASNSCISCTVPACIFPSSNTLVISLPPSFSFNSNQVNSNQFISQFHAPQPQVPSYNPSNMITQFSSPSTSQGASYPLYQGTPLSQLSNNQANINSFGSNIIAQTGFQRAPDTIVLNSDLVSKSQFLPPSDCNITHSTPVVNVQNMSNYNSPKLYSTPHKKVVKKVINRIVKESTAFENTISHSVNSRQKQNSSSTASRACHQPTKHAAAHQDKKELLVSNQQNEDALVKDIVHGLVLWDKVMHNLTGFTCMQRMTEFTATVFSACDFDEFVTVQEYFSNSENLNMLNSKTIDHNFDIPCQVMYRFPEQLLDAPMRPLLKDYVSNHVRHLLNVTNHKDLIEKVYKMFSLKDCFYLSTIVPKEAKKEVSLKILVEYLTFVAVLRIYDEYKKKIELH